MAAQSGKGFIVLTGLLLAIFVVAIVLGGSLLLWQAHRNMTDARQKTSFVSNVSHELKTPLTSIRMYAELLAEGRIKNPEKKKHYLEVIVVESQRLTRLVNNVLHFSRLEQERKKYHIDEIDVVKFLLEILEAHKLRFQEAGLELKIDVPDNAIVVRTDRDAIEQVVLNLMDNALKYAAEGKDLLIRLEVCNGFCELQLMDRGPGVPSTHRAKIFEKFQRMDDSLTTRKPGSGLGLSIARRLMRDLGGDLIYRPRKEGGSCFVVLIPYSVWF
jgi:signal transduction histidine kinase